jgi:hydroxyquinol 1,2-dioxygenase
MRQLDSTNVTDTVLETLAATPDSRLKAILTTVVRHAHDCVGELRLTPGEWLAAVQYLTAVGHACTPHRQEFILLSDTLGVSALVHLLDTHPEDATATASSLLGPFFREHAPKLPLGSHIAPNDRGEQIVVSGQVRDTGGNPIASATIDVWQASSSGLYDIQGPTPETMDFRAQFVTDALGCYNFSTVLPVGYGVPMDGPVGTMLHATGRQGRRPAHVHFLLHATGYRELATALYIASDPHIDSDAVFGVSAALVVEPRHVGGNAKGPRQIVYDFVLARGAREGSGRVGSDPASIVPGVA